MTALLTVVSIVDQKQLQPPVGFAPALVQEQSWTPGNSVSSTNPTVNPEVAPNLS